MIDIHSALYSDISEQKVNRRCVRGTDFEGHKTTGLTAEGVLDPTRVHSVPETQPNDFPPQIGLIIARFDDNVIPTSDQPSVNADYVGRMIPGKIPVQIGQQQTNASVFRMDEKATQITMGCLSAVVTGIRGTPTKVMICRTIAKFASDDMVKEKARAIADRDLPAVNP